MENQIKITRVNNRFDVEMPNGRLHILNERALKWNLKHVFGLSGEDVLAILMGFSLTNTMIVDLPEEKAA